MDRYDEKTARTDEHAIRTDEVPNDNLDVREGDTNPDAREGDILGLSGIDVPKAPGDPSADDDSASVARRRARALGTEEPGPGQENPNRQGGATGIDMGAGGQGTLVRGE